MARMSLLPSLRSVAARAGWEIRRSMSNMRRSFGGLGILTLVCVLVSLGAWIACQRQIAVSQRIATRLGAATDGPAASRSVEASDSRARLLEFEAFLLPHEDIPVVVQDLIALAESDGLILRRGDYRPQSDTQAAYLRSRITLPLKGDPQHVHHFMLAALGAHRTLALEAVQFKRERIESNQIEARIQWALLTHLPDQTARKASEATQ
jgi:hypothetical protein